MAKKIMFYSSPLVALFPHVTAKDMDGKAASKKFSIQGTYQSPEDLAKDKATLTKIMAGFSFSQGTPKLPIKTNKSGEDVIIAKSQYLPSIYSASKALIVDKWANPQMSAEQLKSHEIRRGSIIRLACVVVDYDAREPIGSGISLQLDSVQLIKAAQGGAEGFDVEDGDDYQEAQAGGFSERDDSDEIPF